MGEELPPGTVVYVKSYDEVFATVHIYPHLEFIFDPNDEMYASELAREFWTDNPQRHPKCTLFNILYKNLEN
jgi:hypothetical protein